MHTTTVLVTGASRGLGLALVREVLVDDPRARVLLTARTLEAACGAADALRAEGHEHVRGYALDVRDARRVAHFASTHSDIDIVLNNAAVCHEKWSRAVIMDCWRTNVLGPQVLTHALLPAMLRRRRGHIVHVSSGDGELLYLQGDLQAALQAASSERAVLRTLARATPPRNAFGDAPAHSPTPAYSVSKAALNALTRVAAAHLPPPDACGVRVSAVCPGDVATRMLSTHDPEAVRRALPPRTAARDVWRLAVAGLDRTSAMPSGCFWRHGQQIAF